MCSKIITNIKSTQLHKQLKAVYLHKSKLPFSFMLFHLLKYTKSSNTSTKHDMK